MAANSAAADMILKNALSQSMTCWLIPMPAPHQVGKCFSCSRPVCSHARRTAKQLLEMFTACSRILVGFYRERQYLITLGIPDGLHPGSPHSVARTSASEPQRCSQITAGYRATAAAVAGATCASAVIFGGKW